MEQRRNQIVELVNRKAARLALPSSRRAFPSVSEMTLRTDLKHWMKPAVWCGCMAVSSRWSRW